MANLTKSILFAIAAFAAGFAIRYLAFDKSPSGSPRFIFPTEIESTTENSYNSPINAPSQKFQYRDEWSELFDKLINSSNYEQTYSEIRKQISKLSISDRIDFLKAALAHDDRIQMKQVIGRLIFSIAQEDPQKALAIMDEMSLKDRSQLGQSILSSISRNNPLKTWKWLDSVDRNGIGSFLNSSTISSLKLLALNKIARKPKGAKQALELAISEKDFIKAELYTRSIVRSIAAQDVDQALSLIEDYPEISSIAMEGVVQQWASENLPAAIEFLRSNKDVASPQSISLVARNVLTQQGANALVNLYSSFEDPKFKESIAITAAGYFAKSHDMEGAVHWVDSIENGPRRRQAGVAAIRGMGFNNNMETHIQFIETSFGTNADSQTVYFQSLREWQKISPYKVIEYVDSLPPEANDLRAQLNWQLDLGLE